MSNHVENGHDLKNFIWTFEGSLIYIYNFPKMICHYLNTSMQINILFACCNSITINFIS
jgi:hypothetical protein